MRQVHLSTLALAVHDTFQSLESICREEEILAMAPPADAPAREKAPIEDERRRASDKDGYSERLDIHSILAASNRGPILDGQGKPLRPFTLLGGQSARQELQKGVFRPGHNLPTMTIDEYLEEEKRRGGIIEGGGEASGQPVVIDEDDYARGDEETLKARAWDEYVEANPKYVFDGDERTWLMRIGDLGIL